MMEVRRVGNSTVEVSTLSLGTSGIGNLYRPMDDAVAASIVDAALTAGVTYVDTAPHYGLGLAEQRIGAAIAGVPGVAVSTKVGRILEPNPVADPGDDLADGGFAVEARWRRRWDFSRDGVLRSLDDSTKRLGRDHIDIVFVHDPDDHMAEALGDALPALVELRDAGVVGAIGAGMNSAPLLARFVRTGAVDVVLLAGRYTLLEQEALADVLPAADSTGTSVVIGGVFNSGLLARANVAHDARYDYEEAPPELMRRARRLADVCRDHGTTLPAAAVQFPLAHPCVASVLVGVSSVKQMVDNVDHHQATIPLDLWPALVEKGLLRADAPVPGS